MDGSKHDGKDLSKVPNKVQKKLKSSSKYKQYQRYNFLLKWHLYIN